MFLCIGPQRTASSWLDQVLRCNKQLSLPRDVKETYYFDKFFCRGASWYSGQFYDDYIITLFGEVCSTYFESKAALENIASSCPSAKIIIMIRNPVARTFSSFCHEYSKARVSRSFFDAVAEQPRIVESGRYSELVPLWQEQFPDEQILFLVQDDIKRDPQSEADRVFSFLGVDSVEVPEELKGLYNQRSVPRFRILAWAASRIAGALRAAGLHRVVEEAKGLGLKRVFKGGDSSGLEMTSPIFEYLLEEHEKDIVYLEALLGRTFPEWRDKSTYGF